MVYGTVPAGVSCGNIDSGLATVPCVLPGSLIDPCYISNGGRRDIDGISTPRLSTSPKVWCKVRIAPESRQFPV